MIWWSIVLLAVFLIGLTKSGFGSGAGLMIPPMTALAMSHMAGYGPKAALGFLLPLLIVGDVVALLQYIREFHWPAIQRLLPGTAIGIVLGWLLLRLIARPENRNMVEAFVFVDVGFESVILVLLHFYRVWRAKGELPIYRPVVWRSAAVGTFAGISSTLAHAAGPIISLHLLPQRLPRGVFVGTCALYFAMLNTAKLPAYDGADLFKDAPVLFSLRFVPLLLAGALVGRWMIKRINDVLFANIIYAVTFVLGWYLLVKGGVDLRGMWG